MTDKNSGVVDEAAQIAMIKHDMVKILYNQYKAFLSSLEGIKVHKDVYHIALKELDGGILWMEKAIRMVEIKIEPVQQPDSPVAA